MRPFAFIVVFLCLFDAASALAGAESVLVSGRPDAAALADHAAAGVTLVVDLRTPGEGIAEEAVLVAESGMRYVNLPVGREAASAVVLARVAALLDETEGRVLIHCGSGNRAAEVHARLLMADGLSREQALTRARDLGLKPDREAFLTQ